MNPLACWPKHKKRPLADRYQLAGVSKDGAIPQIGIIAKKLQIVEFNTMTNYSDKAKSHPIIRYSLYFLFSVVGLLSLINSPAPAHACTLPPGGLPPFIIKDHVESSEVVFLGKVVNVYQDLSTITNPTNTIQPTNTIWPFEFQYAEVEVSNYFKGSGKDTVIIGQYGGLCNPSVSLDSTYIFFGNLNNSNTPIDYRANYGKSFRAFLHPSQENIQGVLNSVGIELTTQIYLPIVVHIDDHATVEQSSNTIGAFIKSKPPFFIRPKPP